MRRRLQSCVPLLDFLRGAPPSFLYTSGRAGRCNPAGVECLYFSESEAVAAEEYRLAWRGTPAEHQPKLTFQARVNLRQVLDLAQTPTLEALGLTSADLAASWRGKPLTRLQAIGRAVSRQKPIAAIRYPSFAARKKGVAGWNVAIFPEAIEAPDSVEILGTSGVPLAVLS